jgi:homoserine kinase
MSGQRWDGPSGPVTVSVPATSANLGPGFDALGVALDLTDDVTAQVTDEGFLAEVSGAGAGEVPAGSDHLIISTMLTTFEKLGLAPPPGLRLTCHNRIPHARGLGSSSAAIVAGILLARALAPTPGKDRLASTPAAARTVGQAAQPASNPALALAAELEGHPDNVAPCLLGGFTIAWTSASGADAVRLTPSPDVRPVVYVPEHRGLTAHARAALPEQVPHRDAVFNLARTALLVHALTDQPDHLLRATEDRLHQPYRASSMPQTADLVASLRKTGIPAVVSGAGPSVLALTGDFAPPWPEPPPGWSVHPLSWSLSGASMVDSGHAGGDPVAAGRVR